MAEVGAGVGEGASTASPAVVAVDVLSAIESLLTDGAFQLDTSRIKLALLDAQKLKEWMAGHPVEVKFFQDMLLKRLSKCFQGGVKGSEEREDMWGKYHELRASERYRNFWKIFLKVAGCSQLEDPMVPQHLSHVIFKKLVKDSHPIPTPAATTVQLALSSEERNIVRYVAGYVCATLYRQLRSSGDSLYHSILDMVEEEDDDGDATVWLNIVDRGGLFRVNDSTFLFFVSVEEVVRQYLQIRNVRSLTDGIKDEIVRSVAASREVGLHWSLVGVELEKESGSTLMQKCALQWMTARGHSFAGAFVELYKQRTKKSFQKQKALRTKLSAKEGKKKK